MVNVWNFKRHAVFLKTLNLLGKFNKFTIQVLEAIIYFSLKLPLKAIVKLTLLSKNTIYKIREFLIEKIIKFYINNPIKLGGPGAIINIDETMLNHKIKAHRGRVPTEQIWALVIVDTSFSPSLGYVTIVPNRSKTTLLNIIKNVVREGSTIYTDEWKGYNNLTENNFNHSVVCHKYYF